MTEAGALGGAAAEALVANNVRAADPTIVGAVVTVDANERSTAAVTAAVGVTNNIGDPAIPPRW